MTSVGKTMASGSPVVVLTTVGTEQDARRIATALVELRLAACVNVIPGITSIYRWEGKVTEDAEWLLVIKTTRERSEDLRRELLSMHGYEIAEFVMVAIDEISDRYRKWLLESVQAE